MKTAEKCKQQYKEKDKVVDIAENIRKRIEIIKKEIERRSLNLQKAPEGTLRCYEKNAHYQYAHRTDPKDTSGKFLPKNNSKLIAALAQKEYDRKFIEKATKELKLLENFLKSYSKCDLAGIYTKMHEGKRQLVTPFLTDDARFIREWQKSDYPEGFFPPGYPEYYSLKNLRVHSKSEVIIANALDSYGIPYMYEYPLLLDGKERRPDFTCLNVRKRKTFIWEHLGMMDNVGYANDNVIKINQYLMNGYIPGENVIFTFETAGSPLSSTIAKRMIEQYLL